MICILNGDSKIIFNEEVYDLGITEVLRQNGQVYDEYILEDGQAKIIRRINADGTIKTAEEIEDLGEFNLNLQDGLNSISIMNYNAEIVAKYVIQSDYTDVFATKVEMNSSITQTAEEINLEVSKKVGEDEIISKINQTAEQITINADKIDISGKAVNFETEINETIGPFTSQDSEKLMKYIMGEGTLTVEEMQKYDINQDGKLTASDYVLMRRAVTNGGYYNYNGTFKIDPYSYSKSISLKNSNTSDYEIILSLINNYIRALNTESLSVQNGQFSVTNSYGRMYTQEGQSDFELIVEGIIQCENLIQTSLESKKKNFEKFENALEIVKNAEIYNYNLKSEKDTDKKHYGFVIGEKYKTPDEVIANSGEGIDIYSMCSILWKAVQEQQKQIEELKEGK